MANTTFSGPVRSQNGFQSISIDSTTGAVTVNSSFGTDVVLGTQSLSGAGAVDVTNAFTSLTTSGVSQALTLANGTVGEMKIIELCLEVVDSIPKPLQRIWVHSKNTLGFRLCSHHYPSHVLFSLS